MDREYIKQNKKLLEKLLLGYYYSIPCDNSNIPDKLTIEEDRSDNWLISKWKNNIQFGRVIIYKSNIERYFDDLDKNRIHEAEIIGRLTNEQ